MRRINFDVEGNDLFPAVTAIHCICTRDVDTGERRRFRVRGKRGQSLEDGIKYLATADVLIGHNILEYDLRALGKVLGFQPKPDVELVDTLVLSKLIWTNLKEVDIAKKRVPSQLYNRSHALETWGYRLGIRKGEFGKTADWKEWSAQMEDYCAQDVEVQTTLFQRIEAQGYSELAWNLEHEFRKVMLLQEEFGFPFNKPAAEKLAAQLMRVRVELTDKLQKVFPPRLETMKTPAYYFPKSRPKLRFATKKEGYANGHKDLEAGPLKIKEHPFNPGSRQQIADRLTEKYGWEPTQYTESGQAEISEETLSGLEYPEVKLLLEYLGTEKTLGMVAEGQNAWLKLVKEDGRIHGRINTGGAVTGRCTHSEPNISQVPGVTVVKDKKGNKKVLMGLAGGFGWECRSLYGPAEGHVLVGWDASGLELRCLAHYLARWDGGAFEKVLLKGDVHTHNQALAGLWLRDSAKTFIYAFLYGAGDEKLGKIVRQDCIDAGKPLPKGNLRDLGAGLRGRFLKNFPALKRLKDWIEYEVKTKGHLEGLDGRRLHVRSNHAALNTLLQSCGAVLMKAAVVYQYRFLTQEKKLRFGPDFAFVANIHDEQQTSCLPKYAKIVGESGPKSLKKAGERFGFKCQLDGEFKIAEHWAGSH